MKNNINMFLKGIAGRFSATVVMLALGCFSAIADNTLKINDFSIQRGKTAEVVVYLNNEDKISSLQFEVQLPEGLQYVDKSVAIVSPRITRESHTPGVKNMREGEKNAPFDKFTVFLLSTSATIEDSPIPSNEGGIVKFTVKASNDFKPKADIKISNIIGSDQTNKEDGAYKPLKISMKDVDAKVSLYAGEAYADAEALNVRPNEDAEVGISFDNVVDVDVVALQAKVILPEGVSFNEDKKIIYNDDRLSANVNATVKSIGNNEYSILVASFSGDVFAGDTGTLFNLNLKTAEGFNEGEVKFSEVKVSTADGISCNVECKEGKTLTTNIKVVTDPTGDGMWDIDDIREIANAFLDDNNDSKYDVTGDGYVDSDDVRVAVENFLND